MSTNAKSWLPEPHLLSRRLLDHDHLMTPVLQHFFGDIDARQHRAEETADIYLRFSTLHQQLSPQHLLLEGKLHIVKATLPAALLHDLRTSTTPFGGLLRRYRLNIELRNRCLTAPEPSTQRWGRTLVIHQQETNAIICHVQETLAPEASLLLAQAAYRAAKTKAMAEPFLITPAAQPGALASQTTISQTTGPGWPEGAPRAAF